MRSARRSLAVLALLCSVPSLAAAQAAAPNPDLQECVGLAERGQAAAALPPGRRAEALFRARLARQPRDVEAIVGLARALSQCVLPSADFATQGELSAQAIELLETALELDTNHWVARFVLASIHFRSPAFLGRAPRAARELDVLLQHSGDATANPRLARAFEMRGVLWSRAGRADSARAVWARGARLFPSDGALRALADSAGATTAPVAPSSAAALNAVRVVATASAPLLATPSVRTVGRAQVLMAAGAGADVLQAVQLQPGATRVGEGSDVYTRGGDPAETSLSLDGGRVLSIARFEGLGGGMFGALEPFVVRGVRYSSGGFSARHGNALSGVLEIETDGRPRERQLRAGASLVQASGTARAPIGRRAGAWASARVSHTGALLATHGRTREFDGAPHSEEAIASFVASPSPTSELRATALVERDEARRIVGAHGWTGPFHSAGGTRALLVSSRWVAPRAPVLVRASVAGSRRDNAWDFGVLARDRDEGSLVARADVEWTASTALTVRGGAEEGAFARTERGTLPTTASVAPTSPTRGLGGATSRARHHGGWAEAEWTQGAATLTAGVRADRLPGESRTTLDPRVAVAARRGAWTGRVSGGVFHQGRWRATPTVPDAGTPSGIPGTARHLVVGLEREAPTGTLRVEGYHKAYADYAAHGDGPRITSGTSRGLDLIAQRTGSGRVTGWLAWSLLDATVRLADGTRVRAPFDVTHSVTASATVALPREWSVGSTVRYGTGTPLTPVVGGTALADGRFAPAYGATMGDRLPAHARADLRVMRFVRTPSVLLTPFVEVLNVAGRANATAVTYDARYRTRTLVPSFFAQRTVVAGAEVQFR
ncbi:hypothetical protein [Roseisolibacter agri]|uniref:TonB-dependent receptor-like beta-barrel domain-containing protein n=1 Tax=Roseisolibacter agri TaxID=2014610 RepID=A0AA37Q5Q6_9BACT|nr:hypothetical protein [Roseisolibacter agri]GLC26814.1 hypothetical protein rosag_33270 [Roseisolibacter agri]